jgi:uncharacterized protein (DUF736 family)
MKKIGCFRKEGENFIGTITTLQLNVRARITAVENKISPSAADYIVTHVTGGSFAPELGAAWKRHSKDHGAPYIMVEIDDPSCAEPIAAVLWKGKDDYYYLYWDRNSSGDHIAERLLVQEELKPQLGIMGLPERVTAYVAQIVPELGLA